MKKFFVLAAAILLALPMSAQTKSSADVRKIVEPCISASNKPSKARKAKTWINLGDAYYNAYYFSIGGTRLDMTGADVKERVYNLVSGPESVELSGVIYQKYTYKTCNIYFLDDAVAAFEPTDLAYPEALVLSAEAFVKALGISDKNSDEILEKLDIIRSRLYESGMSWSTLGYNQRASREFEKAYNVTMMVPEGLKADLSSLYNAALTAGMAREWNRSIELFRKCLDSGEDNGGKVYSTLAEIYLVNCNLDEAKAIIEEGYEKRPDNFALLYEEGQLLYNHALDMQDWLANLPNDSRSVSPEDLRKEMFFSLEMAVPVLYACFQKADADAEIKLKAADLLAKSMYFLRDFHEGFEEEAAKYREYVETHKN